MSRRSIGGFRHCLSNVLDPCESWNGVAQGPRSVRSDYIADWDSAGHAYDEGEKEFRSETVDNVEHRTRAVHILERVDYSDAAGGAALRIEEQALTIDDRKAFRRARSEPPLGEGSRTRFEKTTSLQAMGFLPCVDGDYRHRKRCLSPDFGPVPRGQMAKMAMLTCRDLSGAIHKKTFHNCPPPGSGLSPRQAAGALESIDIDAPFGRIMSPRTASIGIVPQEGENYDTQANRDHLAFFCGSPRNRSTGEFFKKTLEAQSYAQLLGRPGPSHVAAIKELANLSEVEVKRQLKYLTRLHSGDTRSVVDGIAQVCWSASQNDRKESKSSAVSVSEPEASPPRTPKGKRLFLHAFSNATLSTACSESDPPAEVSTPLSAASRSVFLAHAEEEEEEEQEAETKLTLEDAPDTAPFSFMADQEEPDSEPPSELGSNTKVPLGLRRVLTSVLPAVENVPEDMLGELGVSMGAIPVKSHPHAPSSEGKDEPLRGRLQRFPLRSKPRFRPNHFDDQIITPTTSA